MRHILIPDKAVGKGLGWYEVCGEKLADKMFNLADLKVGAQTYTFIKRSDPKSPYMKTDFRA